MTLGHNWHMRFRQISATKLGRIGSLAACMLGIASVWLIHVLTKRNDASGVIRRDDFGTDIHGSQAGSQTPDALSGCPVHPTLSGSKPGASIIASVVALAVCLACLIGFPVLGFFIESQASEFAGGVWWQDQPAALISVFMRGNQVEAIKEIYSAIQECAVEETTDASGSASAQQLEPVGWKIALEDDGGLGVAGALGFGLLRSSSTSGVAVTFPVSWRTVPSLCLPSRSGQVQGLVLEESLVYAVTAPLANIYGPDSDDSCATWTTISGRTGSSKPTVDYDWISPHIAQLTCSIEEDEMIADVQLFLPIRLKVNVPSNFAGYSSLIILNDDRVKAAVPVTDHETGATTVAIMAPASYDVMFEPASNNEIVSVMPGTLAYGIRQYAKASLEPGNGMLIRQAWTSVRGMTRALQQFAWMATGVTGGLLPYLIQRLGKAIATRRNKQ